MRLDYHKKAYFTEGVMKMIKCDICGIQIKKSRNLPTCFKKYGMVNACFECHKEAWVGTEALDQKVRVFKWELYDDYARKYIDEKP